MEDLENWPVHRWVDGHQEQTESRIEHIERYITYWWFKCSLSCLKHRKAAVENLAHACDHVRYDLRWRTFDDDFNDQIMLYNTAVAAIDLYAWEKEQAATAECR